jgi:hypothetical protein
MKNIKTHLFMSRFDTVRVKYLVDYLLFLTNNKLNIFLIHALSNSIYT